MRLRVPDDVDGTRAALSRQVVGQLGTAAICEIDAHGADRFRADGGWIIETSARRLVDRDVCLCAAHGALCRQPSLSRCIVFTVGKPGDKDEVIGFGIGVDVDEKALTWRCRTMPCRRVRLEPETAPRRTFRT